LSQAAVIVSKVGHDPYRGERFVWAWDRIHGAFRRIDLGEAAPLRERCKRGDLVCPMADCASPDLTTRRAYRNAFGTLVRDGFRHVRQPTPRHSPESVLHVQGKLHVAAWLTSIGAEDVHVERRDTQARRVPDVTARMRDGTRVAIEVQYSPLTARSWARRNEDLLAAGLRPIWLWGHRGAGDAVTDIRLTPIQQIILRSGEGVWWIDAERGRLGDPFVERPRLREFRLAPEHHDRDCRVEWAPIEVHTLSGGVLEGPYTEARVNAAGAARTVLLTRLANGLARRRDVRQKRALAREREMKLIAEQRARRREERQGSAPAPARPRSVEGVLSYWRATDAVRLSTPELAEVAAAACPEDVFVYEPEWRWHADLAVWIARRLDAGEPPTLADATAFVRSRFAHDPRRVHTAVAAVTQRLLRHLGATTAQDHPLRAAPNEQHHRPTLFE